MVSMGGGDGLWALCRLETPCTPEPSIPGTSLLPFSRDSVLEPHPSHCHLDVAGWQLRGPHSCLSH